MKKTKTTTMMIVKMKVPKKLIQKMPRVIPIMLISQVRVQTRRKKKYFRDKRVLLSAAVASEKFAKMTTMMNDR